MNKMKTEIQKTVKVYEAQSGKVKARLEINYIGYGSNKPFCQTHFHLGSFTQYAGGEEEELRSVDVRDVSSHPLLSIENLELSKLVLELLVQPRVHQTFGILYDVRPEVSRIIGDLRTLVISDLENKPRAGNE